LALLQIVVLLLSDKLTTYVPAIARVRLTDLNVKRTDISRHVATI
jgi:hypothetical protein